MKLHLTHTLGLCPGGCYFVAEAGEAAPKCWGTYDRGLGHRSAWKDGVEVSKGLVLKLSLHSKHSPFPQQGLFRLLLLEERDGVQNQIPPLPAETRGDDTWLADRSQSWEMSRGGKSRGLLSVREHQALPALLAGTVGDRAVCVTVRKDKALEWISRQGGGGWGGNSAIQMQGWSPPIPPNP